MDAFTRLARPVTFDRSTQLAAAGAAGLGLLALLSAGLAEFNLDGDPAWFVHHWQPVVIAGLFAIGLGAVALTVPVIGLGPKTRIVLVLAAIAGLVTGTVVARSRTYGSIAQFQAAFDRLDLGPDVSAASMVYTPSLAAAGPADPSASKQYEVRTADANPCPGLAADVSAWAGRPLSYFYYTATGCHLQTDYGWYEASLDVDPAPAPGVWTVAAQLSLR